MVNSQKANKANKDCPRKYMYTLTKYVFPGSSRHNSTIEPQNRPHVDGKGMEWSSKEKKKLKTHYKLTLITQSPPWLKKYLRRQIKLFLYWFLKSLIDMIDIDFLTFF